MPGLFFFFFFLSPLVFVSVTESNMRTGLQSSSGLTHSARVKGFEPVWKGNRSRLWSLLLLEQRCEKGIVCLLNGGAIRRSLEAVVEALQKSLHSRSVSRRDHSEPTRAL